MPRRETTLTVGQKVYRVAYDQVECGEVMKIGRASYEGGGTSPVEDPDGDWPWIVARFPQGSLYEWLAQTYEWKFFADENRARAQLASDLRDRAARARKDAEKWERLAAEVEPQKANA